MGQIHGSFLLAVLTLAFSIPDTAQTVVSDIHASDSKAAFCTTDQPLYADPDGKPIWLDTDSLLKSATHCIAPKMPALARNARIEGYVSVDILVNDKGKVWCARLVSGHPMLASYAIDAAKDWAFRPMKQEGKAVWFYGHLRFHFSTGDIKKDENPCTVAHW
jgi:TonB family protein